MIAPDGRTLAMKAKRGREKAKRAARTDAEKDADSVKRRARERKAAQREREAQAKRVVAPPPAQPRRTLIHDDRAGTIERRRFDCAHLAACEDQWAATYHVAQAKCVTGCRGFERREFDRLISLGGSGVSLG